MAGAGTAAVLGDCVAVMAGMEPDSFDAIVTDPPYNLGFMGKSWDQKHQHEPWAREAYRVAKPGAHLLAFGGTRTYHRLTCALEDAGWEIRDCLVWAYASGFPKSLNLGNGWGTALKPAWEPIVMARKPLGGTVAANVERWGTGALNIDGTRIPSNGDKGEWPITDRDPGMFAMGDRRLTDNSNGRWPPNLLLTDPLFDGASRFFLVPKASRSDREPAWGDELAGGVWSDGREVAADYPSQGGKTVRRNTHPTTKPIDLMRHLVRLVTPPGGHLLDPFLGSGTTAVAAIMEGFTCIGIEKEPEYIAIAEARLNGVQQGMGL